MTVDLFTIQHLNAWGQGRYSNPNEADAVIWAILAYLADCTDEDPIAAGRDWTTIARDAGVENP